MSKRSFSEFELKDLKDSKGGFFITESEEHDAGKKGQAAENSKNNTIIHVSDDPIMFPLELNPTCEGCDSIELKQELKRNYGVRVCQKCYESDREKYKQITKTQAKEEYLLTEEELRDESLPHLLRANPHKSSWSDMKLFLRCQVEKFAIRKWGSLSNIEVESESRKRLKNEKKEKRFKKKLSELRRTTRTDEWQKQHNLASAASLHQHEFEATSKTGVKKCKSCDLVIEEEEL